MGFKYLTPPLGSSGGGAGGAATQLDANGTILDVNAIADGQYGRRVGSTFVGGTPGGTGDVVGPAGATEGSIPLFDGATGKLLGEAAMVVTGAGTMDVAYDISLTGPAGTIDGRDPSADGTKLDGVEAGAQVTNFTRVSAALAAASAGVTFNAVALTSIGSIAVAQPVATSGSPTALSVVGAAHTTMTASAEDVGVNLNMSATKQWATGALATQREVLVQAPTTLS